MKNTDTTISARRTPGVQARRPVAPFHPLDDRGRPADVVHARLGAQSGHRLAHVLVPAVPQQPPRRLGHLGPQHEPDQGRDGAQAEDQPPADRGGAGGEGGEDDQGDDVRDQDADGDHPLLQHGQRPAPALGRVFGDVSRGDRGIGADGQPDQGPRGQQHRGVPGDRGQDRAGRVDPRVDDQQRLAAEVVRQRPGQDRPGGRAERGAGHQVAQGQAVQVIGHEVQRRADVGRVVSEQEPAQRGQQRQLPVEGGGNPVVQSRQNVVSRRGLGHCTPLKDPCPLPR